jgi:segregation and condensation protein B
LSHFGLAGVGDLPGLDELKQAGMFDGRVPGSMLVPLPTDDPSLRSDEDPLDGDEMLASAEDRINAGEEPLEIELDEDADEALSDADRLDPLEDERSR